MWLLDSSGGYVNSDRLDYLSVSNPSSGVYVINALYSYPGGSPKQLAGSFNSDAEAKAALSNMLAARDLTSFE